MSSAFAIDISIFPFLFSVSITCCACQMLPCHRVFLFVFAPPCAFPFAFHDFPSCPASYCQLWEPIRAVTPSAQLPFSIGVCFFTASNNRKVLLIWFITSVSFPQWNCRYLLLSHTHEKKVCSYYV